MTAQIEFVQVGSIRVVPKWVELFEANNLTTLDDLLNLEGRRLDKPGLPAWRRRLKIRLADAAGEYHDFYLKRYVNPPVRAQWRRCVEGAFSHSTAWIEWRWMQKLEADDIPAVRPVALAESVRLGRERAGAIVTEPVPGRSLEQFARSDSFRFDADLIEELAQLIGRFHGRGYVHRDLYLCHVFFDPQRGPGQRLTLIDLQRVFKPRIAFLRWVVKDLAALHYATPRNAAKRTDRWRFLKRHREISGLDFDMRRLAQRILAKTSRIARHDRRRRRPAAAALPARPPSSSRARMRVGIIVEWLDASRGGAETSTGQFIHALAERDVHVEVFTRSHWPRAAHVGVTTFSSRALFRWWSMRRFCQAAQAWIQAAPIDLAHAFLPVSGADIYQPRGGTYPETARRTIASREGIDALVKRADLALNLRRAMLARAERSWLTAPGPPTVIAISEYVARQLREAYRLPDSRIQRVFNGVDVPELDRHERTSRRHRVRTELGLSDHEPFVLQVCHNFRLKGVATSIRATAELNFRRNVPVTLVVAGRGGVGPFSRLAKRLGVDGLVRFIGPVEDAVSLYCAADVLCHPTFYDPCSRVVLEALAIGLPVVTTRFDGAAELVESGVNGFVCDDPRDEHEVAGMVGNLLTSLRRRVPDATSPTVRIKASMARHADEVIALYDALR